MKGFDWLPVVETVSDLITVHDSDFTIIHANHAAREVLGIDPETVRVKCFEAFHGTSQPPEQCPSCKALKSCTSAMCDFYEPHLDKHLQLNAYRIKAPTAAEDWIVHVARDVSQERILQQRMSAMLEDKTLMLREIHHRIKNNLTVLQGMLGIEARRVDDPGVRQTLTDGANRVKCFALLHDKLYRYGVERRVSIRLYLDELCEVILLNYADLAPGVEITREIEPMKLLTDHVPYVGLVVTEIVSNALKHAFVGCTGGVVKVTFGAAPEGSRLVIEDDGRGLVDCHEMSASSGFGFRLLKGIVSQLGANMQCEKGALGGTRFTVWFPFGHEEESQE